MVGEPPEPEVELPWELELAPPLPPEADVVDAPWPAALAWPDRSTVSASLHAAIADAKRRNKERLAEVGDAFIRGRSDELHGWLKKDRSRLVGR